MFSLSVQFFLQFDFYRAETDSESSAELAVLRFQLTRYRTVGPRAQLKTYKFLPKQAVQIFKQRLTAVQIFKQTLTAVPVHS
jgi:hypothetical protein